MSSPICGFIGLGLIGGSIARALKKYDAGIIIVAYDINCEALALAEKEHIVDTTAPAVDQNFSDCDYIFLCAPVQNNDKNLAAVGKIMKPGCILTDVGSVKTAIHKAVHSAGLDHCFIGGHPMAGSERIGFANSRAALLENAYYILTPSPGVPAGKTDALRSLVEGMGAIPLVLDYEKHDYVVAAISHLPHVVAASLVNLVRDSDDADGLMKMVAAGGFKDITRIASSSAVMWQQICLTNTENISSLLEDYIRALTDFKQELDNRDRDALFQEFDSARVYRDSFINASSGPIKRSFRINAEIADRTGALAHIATLLADRGLSIKNIGISHNRESEDGVLSLEFYSEDTMNQAMGILRQAGYNITLKF